MHTITVVNKRTYKPKQGVKEFYVGRPSPLGNPFSMKSEADRAKVIKEYEEWFYNHPHNDRFYMQLTEIQEAAKTQDIVLVCWCAPKACHADVIKGFLLAWL